MLLDGLHIPLTTPFYPDGRLYLRKLEHNAERYSRSPAAGLTLLGASGEAALLSDDESRQVLRTAIEAAAPQKVMLAHISRDGVSTTLELIEAAAALRYDAVVLHAPRLLHATSSPRSLFTFFQTVVDRSPVPIILEEHSTESPLPIELLSELAANPLVLGLLTHAAGRLHLRKLQAATAAASREATVTTVFAAVTGRMQTPPEAPAAGNYISAGSLSGGATALATAPPRPAIKTRTKKVGFQILTGRTASFVDALEAGVAGAILPLAACAPQAVYEVLAAWKDGDPTLATEKQGRLLAAAAEIEEQLGIPALKSACDLNGYFGGRPRLPLLPLTGSERSRVETLMAGLRN